MINLSEINIKPLEEALSNRFGVDIKLETEVKKGRNDVERFHFCSQDIKSMTGILESVYEYLHITDFGSEVCNGDNGQYLWMGINISFSYNKGGSNGTNIGNCWFYFETNEWRFEIQ